MALNIDSIDSKGMFFWECDYIFLFLNVSGAARTPEIVAHIREQFPEVPIIATGGPTDDTIRATIEAGANAITYTPPTSAELFSESMRKYRGRFA